MLNPCQIFINKVATIVFKIRCPLIQRLSAVARKRKGWYNHFIWVFWRCVSACYVQSYVLLHLKVFIEVRVQFRALFTFKKPLNTATKCRCNFTLEKWLHSLKRNTKVWVTIRVQTIFHKTITFYTVNTKTPSYGHRVLVKLQQWDRIQNMI